MHFHATSTQRRGNIGAQGKISQKKRKKRTFPFFSVFGIIGISDTDFFMRKETNAYGKYKSKAEF